MVGLQELEGVWFRQYVICNLSRKGANIRLITCPYGGNLMHAVIRTYSGEGAKELFDVLEKRKSDVESVIRSLKGFANYSLIRTEDGGISVTVCQDKTGADESSRKAKDWIAKNASGIGIGAPKISEGTVILQLK
jgi:hypothetical protein